MSLFSLKFSFEKNTLNKNEIKKLEARLEYVISRVEYREKILSAIKPLLIPGNNFSPKTENLYFEEELKSEIERTKILKSILAGSDEVSTKWKEFQYTFYLDTDEAHMLMYEEAKTFIKVLISKLFINAVTHSSSSKIENHEKLIIVNNLSEIEIIPYKNYIVWKNGLKKKISESLFITENKTEISNLFSDNVPDSPLIITPEQFRKNDFPNERIYYFYINHDNLPEYPNTKFEPVEFYFKTYNENMIDKLQISVLNRLSDNDKKFFSEEINLKNIFEKGKRSENTINHSGTGLGLYIIKYITEERFNGKVGARIINNDKIEISCYFDIKYLYKSNDNKERGLK